MNIFKVDEKYYGYKTRLKYRELYNYTNKYIIYILKYIFVIYKKKRILCEGCIVELESIDIKCAHAWYTNYSDKIYNIENTKYI